MNELEIMQARAERLCEKINHHMHCYYVLNAPEISDADYDALFRELVDLERVYPELVTQDSPTQRVGAAPLPAFIPFVREVHMISLDNAMNEAEIRDFHERVGKKLGLGVFTYTHEPKFDGLSIEIEYEAGSLYRAGTRGDGLTGEDVTSNVRTIKSVPLRVSKPLSFSVRGEVLLRRDALERLNEERIAAGEKPYANCRNAASGALRQLDSRETAKRGLSAVFYAIRFKHEEMNPVSHVEAISTLKELGFPVETNFFGSTSDIEWVIDAYRSLEAKRYELPYDIDGMVVKVNTVKHQRLLGETSHHPRWAVACKFDPEQATTVCTDVVFSVGRTGQIAPTAVLDPVAVGGVVVSRATLHNEDFIKTKDLKLGDVVVIRRAGEVVPELVEVLKEKRDDGRSRTEIRFPQVCPSCGHEVTRNAGEAAHFCRNKECTAQLEGSVIHFASRDALDIRGLGEKTVALLLEHGKIKSIADIYTLTASDIESLPGFALPSAQKLVKAIEKSKQATLERFVYALGIPLVGQGTSGDLARSFETFADFLNASETQLLEVDGIGSEMAQSITHFVRDADNQRIMRQLFSRGVTVTNEKRKAPVKAEGFFAGKTVVVTGEFPLPRNEIETILETLGAKCSGSVSKKTSLVVVGEKPGGKAAKAKELGLSILYGDEFMRIFNKERGL
jgi:DNA ligase (NAD+)